MENLPYDVAHGYDFEVRDDVGTSLLAVECFQNLFDCVMRDLNDFGSGENRTCCLQYEQLS